MESDMTQAYASLREKIAAESAARRQRYTEFESLYNRAHEAGMAAGNATTPRPMVVSESRSGQSWYVEDGLCGFAWVTVFPGNSSFAHWLKKNKDARKEYGGGVCAKWVSEFNQSVARKEAYAHAFAKVLREAGIKAYSGSRLD